MKAAFASAVLLSTFLAGDALADSGTAKPAGCTLVAPTAQVSDDCKALRADYHARSAPAWPPARPRPARP